MTLLKRLKFALKYNFEPEFIVVPFGEEIFSPVKFLSFEDAVEFTEKEVERKPQFGKPSVLVIINRL